MPKFGLIKCLKINDYEEPTKKEKRKRRLWVIKTKERKRGKEFWKVAFFFFPPFSLVSLNRLC